MLHVVVKINTIISIVITNRCTIRPCLSEVASDGSSTGLVEILIVVAYELLIWHHHAYVLGLLYPGLLYHGVLYHGVLHAPVTAHDETTAHVTTSHDDTTAHDTTAHDTTTPVRRHDDAKSTGHRQP